jgi:hypothetical protein
VLAGLVLGQELVLVSGLALVPGRDWALAQVLVSGTVLVPVTAPELELVLALVRS